MKAARGWRFWLPVSGLVWPLACCLGAAAHLTPFEERSTVESSYLFQRVSPATSGVEFQLRFPPNAHFDLLTDQTSGTGVAIGDVDGDGLPDIFFSGYNQGNRLYRNLGEFRFQDVTETAHVGGEGRWCGGASFVDIDNDGDLDLYVCAYGAPNALYLNRGDGVFDERAKAFGLDFVGASVMMAFADYDRDGDLDGYLVTHRLKQRPHHLLPKGTREAVERGILEINQQARSVHVRAAFAEYFELMDKGGGRKELIIAGQRDRLYRNDGNGRFREVSQNVGVKGTDIGLAATWWDYNDDGWPDLYVSNDYKGADRLYRNRGDGTFSEVARQVLPHIPWFSMGSDQADLNNDGLIDFLASDMSGTDHFSRKMAMGDMGKNRWFLVQSNPQQYMRNAVFLGTGTERVFEVAYQTGLANTDWTWSPKFGDYDLDGRVDLFVSNGMSRDFMNSDLAATIRSREDAKWRKTPVLKQSNLAFRNKGNLQFESIGSEWGLDQVAASYGVASADLDRDGDLDLVVANFDEPVSLFQNQGQAGAGLLVRLVGTKSNRWGIGSKVTATNGSVRRTRMLSTSQGYMSSNEPLVHFGFPDQNKIEQLVVEWPSGIRQVLTDVLPGNQLQLVEPSEGIDEVAAFGEGRPWWERHKTSIPWRHQEKSFDDFQQQPLLPAKLSQSGPGIAVGDVDGDGEEDLFVGGAAGQTGTLLIRRQSAWLTRSVGFEPDAVSEDMGCLLFDCDGDDDLDLYVVSGGVEAPAGDRSYQDRLYLNDGSGNFFKAEPGRLPVALHSGSCVVSGDYDRDGDLDLFVGGRSLPGQYPLSEPNQLLQNQGEGFVEVSNQDSLGLQSTGMVTAALWSDYDLDGWVDLLVAHHWGSIRLYRNEAGRLVDVTERVGLGQARGWWNGITGIDIDRDGDLDYVVSNLGQNTKYHGDSDHPCVIYYGDVDGSGVRRIIEAKFEGDICYPERGRSCSTAAIPSLAQKFSSFRRFALASLPEIYPQQNLEEALRLEANTLSSVVLRNLGDRFEIEPLPALAQVAPGFGVVTADVNSDGLPDVVMAQNDFSPQPETGRMAGGMSSVLAGTEDGQLNSVWPEASGIVVPGDAKAVVVADLDGDRDLELLFTQNNGPIRIYKPSVEAKRPRALLVRLDGPAGNRLGIGAQVRLFDGDHLHQLQEVYGGSGYLGQSSASLQFVLPSGDRTLEFEIRWPDGHRQRIRVPTSDERQLTIQ